MAAGADIDYGARILEAARTVFRTMGADAVGMRDVAREAGVAVGTLYNYYQDKSDLVAAVQEEAAEDLIRRLRLERLNPGRPAARRLERICELALEYAPLFAGHGDLTDLLAPAVAWVLEDAAARGEAHPALADGHGPVLAAALMAGAAFGFALRSRPDDLAARIAALLDPRAEA